MILLDVPERHWVCPNCDVTAVTREARAHTEFHHCGGLAGLWVQMVPDGTDAKVEAFEREDYVGDDLVRLDDNGRPIMAAVTTRDDGTDVSVYAPTALGFE